MIQGPTVFCKANGWKDTGMDVIMNERRAEHILKQRRRHNQHIFVYVEVDVVQGAKYKIGIKFVGRRRCSRYLALSSDVVLCL